MSQDKVHTSSGVSRLGREIIADIERDLWPQGKLPSLRSLEGRYGVSRQTIHRAMQALVASKTLEQRPPSRGYFVKGATQRAGPNAGVSASERISRDLKRRVLQGEFQLAGALPTCKVLQNSYRVSYATIRKALLALVAEGILQRTGSRFRIAEPIDKQRNARGIYLAGARQTLGMRITKWSLDVIAGIERHTRDLGWEAPRYLLIDTATSDEFSSKAPSAEDVAGFIVMHPWGILGRLRMIAAPQRFPYVVIDPGESYSPELRRQFSREEAGYWLCADNQAAGRAIGAHFAAQGHRRIAFLSHLRRDTYRWIAYRLQGLSHFYREADTSLTVLAPPQNASLSAPTRELIDGIERLNKQYVRRSDLPSAAVRMAAAELSYLQSLLSAQAGAEPLFAEALAQKDITAWVCVNDDLALIAREFLLRAGANPGGDIALAGFDNSMHARASDLTSYDFNLQQMGYAAVRCLVRPDLYARAANHANTIEGELMMRGSTRGAP